jgi:hypothetical protein
MVCATRAGHRMLWSASVWPKGAPQPDWKGRRSAVRQCGSQCWSGGPGAPGSRVLVQEYWRAGGYRDMQRQGVRPSSVRLGHAYLPPCRWVRRQAWNHHRQGWSASMLQHKPGCALPWCPYPAGQPLRNSVADLADTSRMDEN